MKPPSTRTVYRLIIAGLLAFWAAVAMIGVRIAGGAESKSLHIEWSYDTSLPGLAGYRIYKDGVPVKTVDDKRLLSTDFVVDMNIGQNNFTMTAFDAVGMESPHSDPFPVVILPGPGITTVRPATGQ